MSLKFSARADTLDFRDRLFQPSLVEVPTRIDLDEFRRFEVPVYHQGHAWACTGFALATVAHYLLRRRRVDPDRVRVSPCMLFEMARRYDEYSGERYLGASARGAMKGWHYHGVCREELWPFRVRNPDRRLTPERSADALRRPLGAYLRVNHHDLVSLHCALAEVGVLYATANVHEGWLRARRDGRIGPGKRRFGGHAIALVGYDERGFWLQNSWGTGWGKEGFGFLPYDDWLENGLDVWIGRIGAPVEIQPPGRVVFVKAVGAAHAKAHALQLLRPHLVRIGPDGLPRSNDLYGTSVDDLAMLFEEHFPRATRGWKRRRLLLFANAALSSADEAVEAFAGDLERYLAAEVYPVLLLWRTGLDHTLGTVLRDVLARKRGDLGADHAPDFLLDRLDDALEPMARKFGGRLYWEEVGHTAHAATAVPEGAARLIAGQAARLAAADPGFELHLLGHGAGALLLAPLVQLLTSAGRVPIPPMRGRLGLDLAVSSCVLWAPACPSDLFHRTFYQALFYRRIRRFLLITLGDRAERDDACAGIYHKSLLYLIANALETTPRVPPSEDGTALVGMEKHVRQYPELLRLFRRRSARWLLAPHAGAGLRSTARRHADFAGDRPTLQATLRTVLAG